MNAKKSVRDFKRQFHLDIINSAFLCDVIKEQGYTVVEYNGVNDSEEVNCLIESLQIEDQINSSKGFTFKNDKFRIVFIHEDLNEEERTMVLAHEEGHIWNKHMSRDSVFGEDVVQEYQANEFAHYLLKDKDGKQRQKKVTACFFLLVLLIFLFTDMYANHSYEQRVYKDNFYRTDNGEKYHIKDCIYIKDKTNIRRLTIEEYESGEYKPCEVCMPDTR